MSILVRVCVCVCMETLHAYIYVIYNTHACMRGDKGIKVYVWRLCMRTLESINCIPIIHTTPCGCTDLSANAYICIYIHIHAYMVLTTAHEATSVPPEALVKYLPAGHAVQEPAISAEYLPAAHCGEEST